jgi:TRAP-type C4-dicarboxylate transport system permease small subunit
MMFNVREFPPNEHYEHNRKGDIEMRIQSIVALLILLIPGFLAVYGWKLMRDTIMNATLNAENINWLLFLLGLFFFVGGLAYVGGFIFYRDRKRKKVQPRFRNDIDDLK